MTKDEIKATVLRLLGDVAPEADLTRLNPDVGFRDQLDIDSMDFLNFVIALHETLHVDIPESDYPQVATLTRCVDHLAALLAGKNLTAS
ncbi:MAG: acyl carrier protein [Candidatus Binatia bacterium]